MVKAPAKKKTTAKARKTTGKTPAKKAKPPASAASPGDLVEPFSALRREIDRVFENFTRSFPSMFEFDPFRRLGPVFQIGDIKIAPKVEVSEDEKTYAITAELPGVEEKDVTLTLQDQMLTISGEKKSEREEEEEGYHMSERSYGTFRRSFRLPEDVNADKISAKFDKGIMTVTLPRTAKAKPKGRRIPIK